MKKTSEYKNLSIEESLKMVETSRDGLTESEALRRIALFGFNEVAEERRHPLLEFLLRYWGPMPWLLELAMILSLFLRHYAEGVIIFVLLSINAVISHVHSRNSQRAVELLKTRLAVKAKVLRDKKWTQRDARDLVPGDIIIVRLGDIVPADAVAASGELSVDQSALTGESLPIEAGQSTVIYSGSVVKRGEALCVVVNTGVHTFFGKTAELVKIAKPKSHQEEIMMAIVKYMMFLGIAATILVCGYAFYLNVGAPLILTFAVIFLMGAVPVALPAVLTIVQTVGAMELSRKGVLVTRLDSIEDAASIDVLCLDKTGTITQNRLSVAGCLSLPGFSEEDVVRTAALASRGEGMDSIDLALIDYAGEKGVDMGPYRQVSYIPFSPSGKRTEALFERGGKRGRALKGAFQVVLSLCSGTDPATAERARHSVEEFSLNGYRTIAVARSEDDSAETPTLVGLLALADPPRPDSHLMIAEAARLGIKPMMLTGDHIAVARQIARVVGIGDNIIRLKDIERMNEDEQGKTIAGVDGFAEIYPEDKFRIVKLLQSRGHMVGMTGDGVNDAPALKQAEMGIAVSNATDVAKAAASVVLTEEGVSVIIDAVKISRQTYQRMLSWVINKVTKVIEFVGVLTLGFLWLHKLVLSLLGMSLLVFANDFVTMSLSTDNVKHTSNPNKWDVKSITLASLVPGLLLVVEGIVVIFAGKNYFLLDWPRLRALVMLNLVFNSQFRVLIVRERRHFWSSLPGRGLLVSSAASLIAFGLMGIWGGLIPALAVYQVAVVLGFSALFTLAIDFPKYLLFKRFGL